jgi:phosphoribosylanthranilate isomerase
VSSPARIRVKICGVNTPAAAEAAHDAGADWIGFAFFPPSPRAVTPEQAARLSLRVPPPDAGGPGRVGLFVDPTDQEIIEALRAVPLDALQLYSDALRTAELRARFGIAVWRAVGISERADAPDALAGADALVLEARAPADAARPGGNARSFDWSLLAGWRAPGPWILAGGLDPANVAEAVRVSAAAAVDVSSGVERAPGVKDRALIRAFVAAARAAASPPT